MARTGLRARAPRAIAVIDRDCCTGCEACRDICPVDCILLMRQPPGVCGIDVWCTIDADRCIGCRLCVHLPRRRSDPYELKICPWDAITMVPTPEAAPAG